MNESKPAAPHEELLQAFARSLRAGSSRSALDSSAIANKLFETLSANRSECGIVDVWVVGEGVEMELANGEFWAAECISDNAFRLYPALVRDDAVVWMNVWVAKDYSLDTLVENLAGVLASARAEKKKELRC